MAPAKRRKKSSLKEIAKMEDIFSGRKSKASLCVHLEDELERSYHMFSGVVKNNIKNHVVFEADGRFFLKGSVKMIADHLFLYFFNRFYSRPPNPTERGIIKRLKTKANRELCSLYSYGLFHGTIDEKMPDLMTPIKRNQIKGYYSSKIISDIYRCADIFDTAIGSVFRNKVDRINQLVRNNVIPNFSDIAACKKEYLSDIESVDNFIENFCKTGEEFSNGERPVWDLYISYIGRFFKVNSGFAMHVFDKVTDIFEKHGKDSLDEIISFAEDANKFCPAFFDAEIFKEYVNFMQTGEHPSARAECVIQDVLACQGQMGQIREKLISQIKSQKDSDVIVLDIPDLFYMFKSQVDAYNKILGGSKYFDKESAEDRLLIEKLPVLDEIVKGEVEVVALGCGTGISELRIANAIAQRPGCEKVKVYLVDVSESMIKQAAFNFYEARIRSSDCRKIKAIPSRCNFLNMDDVKDKLPVHEGKKRIYMMLGGTIGNYPYERRQRIYGNIESMMRDGDVFINSCGVKEEGVELDGKHYRGKDEADWLFYPLKILGIGNEQVKEFSDVEKFEFRPEEGKRLSGYFEIMADEVNVGDVVLRKRQKIRMLHSERFKIDEFEKEMDMFNIPKENMEKNDLRAVAICYKRPQPGNS